MKNHFFVDWLYQTIRLTNIISFILCSFVKIFSLNPNYDLFDCQTNTFTASENAEDASELDMGIFFRVGKYFISFTTI